MPDRSAAPEIVATRILDAPREVVFRAFTDPDRLAHWWGPKGFTNTFHQFDPRPGGKWRFVMCGPAGRGSTGGCGSTRRRRRSGCGRS